MNGRCKPSEQGSGQKKNKFGAILFKMYSVGILGVINRVAPNLTFSNSAEAEFG